MYNHRDERVRCGIWSWNQELFDAKVQKGAADDCWSWTGALGPFGGLFGAFKNDKNQMTQARRIAYMIATGREIETKSVRNTCGNKFCMNPAHMVEGTGRGEKQRRMDDVGQVLQTHRKSRKKPV